MYKYFLTVKDMLVLKTEKMFTHEDTACINLELGKVIPVREI
jgi:hypothetical protein